MKIPFLLVMRSVRAMRTRVRVIHDGCGQQRAPRSHARAERVVASGPRNRVSRGIVDQHVLKKAMSQVCAFA